MVTPESVAEPGAERALDALFDEFYAGLRRTAHRANIADAYAAIDTTILVHEAYLKLRHREDLRFSSEAQFYAYAARVMRSVLMDTAKSSLRHKRESGNIIAGMDSDSIDLHSSDSQREFFDTAQHIIALDAALESLRADDSRAAEVVELHYYAGLSFEQIAPLLALSARTVKRDWEYARAFLYAALQ